MAKVKIYTWTFCPFCNHAKDLLNSKGIKYEEHVLDNKDDELQKLREETGQRSIPQIFIGEEFIGGFSELEELDKQGYLENLRE